MSRIKEVLQNKKIIIPGVRRRADAYQAVPLALLTTGTAVPFAVYVRVRPRGHHQALYLLCCAPGQVFPSHWQARMQELKIYRVYIRREDEGKALTYLLPRVKEGLTAKALGNREKAKWAYEVSLLWLRQLFTLDKDRITGQMEIGLNLINYLFEIIRQEENPGGLAFDLWRQEGLAAHGLHSCLLSLGFSRYLGWQEKDAKALGFTALVHDVGMAGVPRHILDKVHPLTAAEKGVIKTHPEAGFNILWDSPWCRWQSLLTVLQHHENCDGSGYPEKLQQRQIHPWARVLRILDSFAAMVSARGWRAARSPQEALWRMRQDWEKSRVYDSDYLSRFIKFLAGSRIIGK